ncbi:MAG: hypothetical protein ACTHP8_14690 [Bosea sp. (in: a-proteobacteria)]|uniref:hypothetical protein n=1 Tax=Bosea sp. (in: a-proteobacteria) TaxID=1871050 RepID=UPI003F7C3001
MTIEKPIARPAADVPDLALTHGQAIRLMSELGLREGVTDSTFNYYVKSLHKLGIPFGRGQGQRQGQHHVTYAFEDLMELTVALLLRVYGTLPDTIVAGLRDFREELRPIYRQAYRDSVRHAFPPAYLSTASADCLAIEGLFLDLNIRYAAGQMVDFGPPRTLSPFEALAVYSGSEIPARSYLPLNVSVIAEKIVGRARVLPSIRRGRSARRAAPS